MVFLILDKWQTNQFEYNAIRFQYINDFRDNKKNSLWQYCNNFKAGGKDGIQTDIMHGAREKSLGGFWEVCVETMRTRNFYNRRVVQLVRKKNKRH